MRGGRATRRPVAKSAPAARSPDEQRRLEELSATLPALQAALTELREAKVPLQRRVAEAKQAGTRYDRACALETRLALLENVQVREVEWTISDYSALLENCPKGQCITSPTFAAGGVPNMQLVFHPNGSKDASDGYSSIALRIPEGMSVSRVLYVNQDHFGPNIVKQAVEGYTNAARISPPSAPLRGTAADIIVVGVRELYQHGWAADPMLQKVLLIGDAPAAEINFELLKEQRERRLQQERERCRQEAEAKRQALADEQEVAEEAARRAAAAEAEALAKVVSTMDEPVSPDQVMMQGAVKAAQERAEKAATKVESPEERAAREKKEQAYAWLLEYQRQQAEEKAEVDRLRQERERAEKEVKMEADKRRKAEEEREYEEAARRSEEEQAEAMAKLRREREEAEKMEAERRRRRDEEEQAEIQRRAEQLKEERRREEEERRREDEARRRLEEEVRQAEEEALRMEQQQQREAEARRRQLEEENRRLEEERQRKEAEKRAEAERTRQRQEELRRLEEQRRAFERAEEERIKAKKHKDEEARRQEEERRRDEEERQRQADEAARRKELQEAREPAGGSGMSASRALRRSRDDSKGSGYAPESPRPAATGRRGPPTDVREDESDEEDGTEEIFSMAKFQPVRANLGPGSGSNLRAWALAAAKDQSDEEDSGDDELDWIAQRQKMRGAVPSALPSMMPAASLPSMRASGGRGPKDDEDSDSDVEPVFFRR